MSTDGWLKVSALDSHTEKAFCLVCEREGVRAAIPNVRQGDDHQPAWTSDPGISGTPSQEKPTGPFCPPRGG